MNRKRKKSIVVLISLFVFSFFCIFSYLPASNTYAWWESHSDDEEKEIWEGCETCSGGGVKPLNGTCPNTPSTPGPWTGGGECTEEEVPDMQDIGIPPEGRARLMQNCGLYKLAAAESCIPWQMFMAIHYREGTGNGSLSNGYPELCNGADTGCVDICCLDANRVSQCPTAENDAKCAAKILKDKFNAVISGGFASGDPCAPDDNLAKWAFYFYNGYTHETPDDRTYVMSWYPGWGGYSDANPGTYTIYAKLMGRF